jgi:outer membrane protein assembly factor BamB
LAVACAGIASPRGWASPTLADQLLLVAHRDELFALERDTFRPVWAFPSNGDIDVFALYGTPALLSDAAYVPTYDGTVYALDLQTGEPLWPEPFDAHSPIIGGIEAGDGALYFGADDGKVYALEAGTGDPIWPLPFEAKEAIWATPTLSGNKLYVTSLDGNLYALDPATGLELWRYETAAGIGSPAVVDETRRLVYVGGFDSRLRAIDTETHEQRWSVRADNWFWTRPLVTSDAIYIGSLDRKVYAIDPQSGDLLWPPFPVDDALRAAPVLAGDTLIVIDKDGKVYGIDSAGGTALRTEPLALDDHVLADPLLARNEASGEDEVIVVTSDGDVVVIDPVRIGVVDRVRVSD